jgi:DNA-binding CsgD family transcriptional regulator
MDPAHVCTEVLHAASDASPSLIMCSVFRDAGSGPLTSENRAWMSVLLPHLSRALSVMYRLREAEQISAASLGSLEKIGCAVVLMGNGGEVLLANQAARRMLEERDGLRLVGIRGSLSRRRLAAEDAAAQQRIEVSVESCLRAQSGEASRFHQGVSVPRPSGRKPYLLQFSTLSSAHTAAASAGLAKVMVLLTDLEEPVRLDAELLRKLYRMTHTETTLAERLCQGRRLQEAAQELGISHHTARSHLKSIFRKTGTGGQRELVRMLLALRAPSLA